MAKKNLTLNTEEINAEMERKNLAEMPEAEDEEYGEEDESYEGEDDEAQEIEVSPQVSLP